MSAQMEALKNALHRYYTAVNIQKQFVDMHSKEWMALTPFNSGAREYQDNLYRRNLELKQEIEYATKEVISKATLVVEYAE